MVPAFSVLLLIACGGDNGTVSLPSPLPMTDRDTSFVEVPGGTYVTSRGDTLVTDGFRLGRYEVTNRLYYGLALETGVDLPPDPGFAGMTDYLFEHPDYPVVNVSAEEAMAICAGMGGRLPTEAEWEYAAALDLTGPSTGQYPWGPLSPLDAEYPANYLAGDQWETRSLDGYPWTAPVDSFPLTDMGFACQAGNVAEWTLTADTLAAFRGGAWLSSPEDITIDSRGTLSPSDRARHVGFRVLLPEL